MTLNANAFSKCAPAISTSLKQCGSVALCDAIPLTTDDLATVYQTSGDMRVMDALLMADFEIKQCEANQNGLYEFLMANKVNLSHKVVPTGINGDIIQIAPFIKADQFSPINNEYWAFQDGAAEGSNWRIDVKSPTGIPYDVRTFPVGRSVILHGRSAAGSATTTHWFVVAASDQGDNTGSLVLEPNNDNSHLDSDKLEEPVFGYLRIGTNNFSDYEKNCDEQPAYINNKMVPFWVQTMRWSWCSSSAYTEYREIMLKSNALYRKFFDLPETKRNKQLMLTQQKHFVNQFFYSKARDNQTLADYDQLEEIEAFDASALGLGVEGGICVGKRAEMVGVMEQLAECGRVVDLQGDNVNLPALFRAFYDILRVREGNGDRNKIIDVFTDTFTAELLNRAMIKYYSSKAEDHNGDAIMRGTWALDSGYGTAKKANFGFFFRSYPLDMPLGATMNVITHYAFDDELDVANIVGIENVARKLWVLDFTGIYPGIVASNRLVAKTGDLKTLASINPDFACVLKVHTREQSLFSVSAAVVVECPAGNLVLENFTGFDHAEQAGLIYPGITTSTTSNY
jgi:hypothetical protein